MKHTQQENQGFVSLVQVHTDDQSVVGSFVGTGHHHGPVPCCRFQAGFSMTHIKGSKRAMISRALSTSASPSRSRRGRVVSAAVFRADRAGAQDGGLKFRHDVQGDDLPARRLEGPAHRLGAAEKLQESRHF